MRNHSLWCGLPAMNPDALRDIILDITEKSLEAQLKAVRRLQGRLSPDSPPSKSMSQIDIVYDILQKAGRELHFNEILRRAESTHGVRLDRESIVSTLTKKVHRNDRFVRIGKNTFSLRAEDES